VIRLFPIYSAAPAISLASTHDSRQRQLLFRFDLAGQIGNLRAGWHGRAPAFWPTSLYPTEACAKKYVASGVIDSSPLQEITPLTQARRIVLCQE
jgi:hypothetical protein